MFFNFFLINAMHQWDIEGRNGLPLGQENWPGPLIKSDPISQPRKREPRDGPLPV